MEEDEREKLYYLGEKLKNESQYRMQQEAVNSKLMTEQDALRKKLAEAELHIDKMRFGASVDINKRFIVSHEVRQCVTLQQKLAAQGLSKHSENICSWPGPLIPSSPLQLTVKEDRGDRGKERDYVTIADGEPDSKVSRGSHVACEKTKEEVCAIPQHTGRNDILFPSQTLSKDVGISTEYEEHKQASSSQTLPTPTAYTYSPGSSKGELHQTTATLTCSEKSLQTSPTYHKKLFREIIPTSHADQEDISSLFFSDTMPPDHSSHETSVSSEKNYNTPPPPDHFSHETSVSSEKNYNMPSPPPDHSSHETSVSAEINCNTHPPPPDHSSHETSVSTEKNYNTPPPPDNSSHKPSVSIEINCNTHPPPPDHSSHETSVSAEKNYNTPPPPPDHSSHKTSVSSEINCNTHPPPPDHSSHETSVSAEKNYNTPPPSLLNFSNTDTDSPSCEKDIPPCSLDEQARRESLSLSQLFRIHNLLEKISSLKRKADQEMCIEEELSDGFKGVLLEHEKLVSEIGKAGQLVSAMGKKHNDEVSEESREALEDLLVALAEDLKDLDDQIHHRGALLTMQGQQQYVDNITAEVMEEQLDLQSQRAQEISGHDSSYFPCCDASNASVVSSSSLLAKYLPGADSSNSISSSTNNTNLSSEMAMESHSMLSALEELSLTETEDDDMCHQRTRESWINSQPTTKMNPLQFPPESIASEYIRQNGACGERDRRERSTPTVTQCQSLSFPVGTEQIQGREGEPRSPSDDEGGLIGGGFESEGGGVEISGEQGVCRRDGRVKFRGRPEFHSRIPRLARAKSQMQAHNQPPWQAHSFDPGIETGSSFPFLPSTISESDKLFVLPLHTSKSLPPAPYSSKSSSLTSHDSKQQTPFSPVFRNISVSQSHSTSPPTHSGRLSTPWSVLDHKDRESTQGPDGSPSFYTRVDQKEIGEGRDLATQLLPDPGEGRDLATRLLPDPGEGRDLATQLLPDPGEGRDLATQLLPDPGEGRDLATQLLPDPGEGRDLATQLLPDRTENEYTSKGQKEMGPPLSLLDMGPNNRGAARIPFLQQPVKKNEEATQSWPQPTSLTPRSQSSDDWNAKTRAHSHHYHLAAVHHHDSSHASLGKHDNAKLAATHVQSSEHAQGDWREMKTRVPPVSVSTYHQLVPSASNQLTLRFSPTRSHREDKQSLRTAHRHLSGEDFYMHEVKLEPAHQQNMTPHNCSAGGGRDNQQSAPAYHRKTNVSMGSQASSCRMLCQSCNNIYLSPENWSRDSNKATYADNWMSDLAHSGMSEYSGSDLPPGKHHREDHKVNTISSDAHSQAAHSPSTGLRNHSESLSSLSAATSVITPQSSPVYRGRKDNKQSQIESHTDVTNIFQVNQSSIEQQESTQKDDLTLPVKNSDVALCPQTSHNSTNSLDIPLFSSESQSIDYLTSASCSSISSATRYENQNRFLPAANTCLNAGVHAGNLNRRSDQIMTTQSLANEKQTRTFASRTESANVKCQQSSSHGTIPSQQSGRMTKAYMDSLRKDLERLKQQVIRSSQSRSSHLTNTSPSIPQHHILRVGSSSSSPGQVSSPTNGTQSWTTANKFNSLDITTSASTISSSAPEGQSVRDASVAEFPQRDLHSLMPSEDKLSNAHSACTPSLHNSPSQQTSAIISSYCSSDLRAPISSTQQSLDTLRDVSQTGNQFDTSLRSPSHTLSLRREEGGHSKRELSNSLGSTPFQTPHSSNSHSLMGTCCSASKSQTHLSWPTESHSQPVCPSGGQNQQHCPSECLNPPPLMPISHSQPVWTPDGHSQPSWPLEKSVPYQLSRVSTASMTENSPAALRPTNNAASQIENDVQNLASGTSISDNNPPLMLKESPSSSLANYTIPTQFSSTQFSFDGNTSLQPNNNTLLALVNLTTPLSSTATLSEANIPSLKNYSASSLENFPAPLSSTPEGGIPSQSTNSNTLSGGNFATPASSCPAFSEGSTPSWTKNCSAPSLENFPAPLSSTPEGGIPSQSTNSNTLSGRNFATPASSCPAFSEGNTPSWTKNYSAPSLKNFPEGGIPSQSTNSNTLSGRNFATPASSCPAFSEGNTPSWTKNYSAPSLKNFPVPLSSTPEGGIPSLSTNSNPLSGGNFATSASSCPAFSEGNTPSWTKNYSAPSLENFPAPLSSTPEGGIPSQSTNSNTLSGRNFATPASSCPEFSEGNTPSWTKNYSAPSLENFPAPLSSTPEGGIPSQSTNSNTLSGRNFATPASSCPAFSEGNTPSWTKNYSAPSLENFPAPLGSTPEGCIPSQSNNSNPLSGGNFANIATPASSCPAFSEGNTPSWTKNYSAPSLENFPAPLSSTPEGCIPSQSNNSNPLSGGNFANIATPASSCPAFSEGNTPSWTKNYSAPSLENFPAPLSSTPEGGIPSQSTNSNPLSGGNFANIATPASSYPAFSEGSTPSWTKNYSAPSLENFPAPLSSTPEVGIPSQSTNSNPLSGGNFANIATPASSCPAFSEGNTPSLKKLNSVPLVERHCNSSSFNSTPILPHSMWGQEHILASVRAGQGSEQANILSPVSSNATPWAKHTKTNCVSVDAFQSSMRNFEADCTLATVPLEYPSAVSVGGPHTVSHDNSMLKPDCCGICKPSAVSVGGPHTVSHDNSMLKADYHGICKPSTVSVGGPHTVSHDNSTLKPDYHGICKPSAVSVGGPHTVSHDNSALRPDYHGACNTNFPQYSSLMPTGRGPSEFDINDVVKSTELLDELEIQHRIMTRVCVKEESTLDKLTGGVSTSARANKRYSLTSKAGSTEEAPGIGYHGLAQRRKSGAHKSSSPHLSDIDRQSSQQCKKQPLWNSNNKNEEDGGQYRLGSKERNRDSFSIIAERQHCHYHQHQLQLTGPGGAQQSEGYRKDEQNTSPSLTTAHSCMCLSNLHKFPSRTLSRNPSGVASSHLCGSHDYRNNSSQVSNRDNSPHMHSSVNPTEYIHPSSKHRSSVHCGNSFQHSSSHPSRSRSPIEYFHSSKPLEHTPKFSDAYSNISCRSPTQACHSRNPLRHGFRNQCSSHKRPTANPLEHLSSDSPSSHGSPPKSSHTGNPLRHTFSNPRCGQGPPILSSHSGNPTEYTFSHRFPKLSNNSSPYSAMLHSTRRQSSDRTSSHTTALWMPQAKLSSSSRVSMDHHTHSPLHEQTTLEMKASRNQKKEYREPFPEEERDSKSLVTRQLASPFIPISGDHHYSKNSFLPPAKLQLENRVHYGGGTEPRVATTGTQFSHLHVTDAHHSSRAYVPSFNEGHDNHHLCKQHCIAGYSTAKNMRPSSQQAYALKTVLHSTGSQDSLGCSVTTYSSSDLNSQLSLLRISHSLRCRHSPGYARDSNNYVGNARRLPCSSRRREPLVLNINSIASGSRARDHEDDRCVQVQGMVDLGLSVEMAARVRRRSERMQETMKRDMKKCLFSHSHHSLPHPGQS